MISVERLHEFLSGFPGLSIALLGDLFLDRYLEIEPEMDVRSIETGLEAYQVTRVRNSPGALGTVINNLVALGVGKIVPVTVIGDDGLGDDLKRQLTGESIDPQHVVCDADRLTPTYMKPLQRQPDGSWNELNRFDVRTCSPLSPISTSKLCSRLEEALQSCDGLIVIDHVAERNWGVVNDAVREVLHALADATPEKLIFIDSRTHLASFRFGNLKGNESEVIAAGAQLGAAGNDYAAATSALAAQSGRTAWCTLAERGMAFVRPATSLDSVPAFSVDGPVDIVGAGDAATSALVASLLAGADEHEASVIGNLAASITVTQLGTTGTATPEQLCVRLALG